MVSIGNRASDSCITCAATAEALCSNLHTQIIYHIWIYHIRCTVTCIMIALSPYTGSRCRSAQYQQMCPRSRYVISCLVWITAITTLHCLVHFKFTRMSLTRVKIVSYALRVKNAAAATQVNDTTTHPHIHTTIPTHTLTHTHKHTHTHTTHGYTHICIYARTHTHTHTHTDTRRYTPTRTHAHSDTQTHRHSKLGIGLRNMLFCVGVARLPNHTAVKVKKIANAAGDRDVDVVKELILGLTKPIVSVKLRELRQQCSSASDFSDMELVPASKSTKKNTSFPQSVKEDCQAVVSLLCPQFHHSSIFVFSSVSVH